MSGQDESWSAVQDSGCPGGNAVSMKPCSTLFANVEASRRMLGHAKASMTLDVYADPFDDDLDAVADQPDEAIKSAAERLRTTSAR